MLAFSEACERNKEPIARQLAGILLAGDHVLEIGSGTGQHVEYFAARFPRVTWQPTDQAEYLPGICQRVQNQSSANIHPPRCLDVLVQPWPDEISCQSFEVVYSANTLHIMSWQAVQSLFRSIGQIFSTAGALVVYGPFFYQDAETAPSNAEFDRFLRERDSASGIRRFHEVDALAAAAGMTLAADHPMPANNRLLVWHRERLPA